MFLVDFQALIQHQNCRIRILFVVMSILGYLKVQISIRYLFLLRHPPLSSQFLDQQLLQLSSILYVFSRFLVGRVVVRPLLL